MPVHQMNDSYCYKQANNNFFFLKRQNHLLALHVRLIGCRLMCRVWQRFSSHPHGFIVSIDLCSSAAIDFWRAMLNR